MKRIVLVLTTCPDDDRAQLVARALVDQRLAACVNISAPMTAVYRWNGAVSVDTERQLVIKTTDDRVAAIQAQLGTLHPYELPEFLVVAVESGSDAYLSWVAAESASAP